MPAAVPVDRANYQNIQTNPRQFGAQIGVGEEEFGAGALAAGKLFGQVAADQAINNWESESNKLLFGDPANPNDHGFYGLHGQEALDAMPGIQERLLGLRKSIGGTLSSLDQQILFDRGTSGQQFRLLQEMGRHYDQQAQIWGNNVNKDTVANRVQSITSRPDDDENFDHSTADIMGALTKNLQLQGGANNPEMVQHAMTTARQSAVAARIEGWLANGQAGKAAQFFRDNGDILKGPLGDSLKTKLDHAEAMAQVNTLVQRATGASGAPSVPRAGQSPRSGGWGPLAQPAIDTFRAAGASDAFIQGAMANGLGEGGFKEPWQQSWVGGQGQREKSFGHWQLHKGGELEGYLAAEGGANPQDTGTQAKFLMRRMEEIQPGITQSNDPRAVTDAIATQFEKYQGAAPGQRYGQLAEAQRQMAAGQGADTITRQPAPAVAATPAGNAPAMPPGPPAPGVADVAAMQAANARAHATAVANLFADPDAQANPAAMAAAEHQINLRYQSRELALSGQMKALTETRNATLDGYTKRMMKSIIAGVPDVGVLQEATNDPNLDAASRENLLRLYQSAAKQNDQTKYSPKFWEVYSRVTAPSTDPNKIRDPSEFFALANPKADGTQDLTLMEVDKLAEELKKQKELGPGGEAIAKRKEELLRAVKPLIDKSNPLMGKIDQSGPLQLYSFGFALDQKIDEYRAAGKDPNNLFNPASPDYMGRAEMLAPYQKPLQQSLKDRVQGLTSGTAPLPASVPVSAPPVVANPALQRRPGETPAEFLQRVRPGMMPAPASTPAVEAPVR